jgi:uncharacterized protein
MTIRTSLRRSTIAKSIGASLFALALVSAPAAADDAAHAAAQELVDFTSNRMMNDMFTRMTNAMWPNIQAAMPKNLDEKAIADFRADFDRIVRKYVTESMKAAPDIYAQHFTADELHQLLAFYKTPLGDKMLNEMPKVMADYTTKALVPMMAPMQGEIRDSLQALMKAHSAPTQQ